MRINQHTKISELISYNDLSIEAIAAIAKPLRKIRIPVLRRILAPRVSIGEAAKIGGCSVADFRAALVPLGFIWMSDGAEKVNDPFDAAERPSWMDDAAVTVVFDVRPLLEMGQDPLKDIFQLYRSLVAGGILCISNSFVPIPLIRRMEERGVPSYSHEWAEGEFRSYFYKKDTVLSVQPAEGDHISFVPKRLFEQKLARLSALQLVTLDVRTLPMPQPMESILEALAQLKADEVVYVKHRKVPLHLLEELDHFSYRIFIHEQHPGDVHLLIYPVK
ncbi:MULTISPECIES: DUF2249 domain-containing protein [Sphingobacterium]|jgi:uncharacterized protein (DUF2249 family)|uniref:Uncharacterized conserved protein (DUF2249) n=2 Tax=Sphingobacterium TaxID=28453 RepID=A0A2X2IMW7_SPHMU|nr:MULTISPECIES: DUF2249 domain-containing protein [Sphingobacterium]HAK29182.1 DUF2249 domain-containing protein [Sphingobacterium sp.]APU96316.1 hypothetical protein BV902_08130 [Sphingobacterium sp. B29]MDF2849749.1 hypothetical protein [Sphingobacterium multivorum]QRQ59811.1 DUF2249 domain-containing protein [Sphingobacterium multivorum]TWI21688.1 uncharacterized protein DUF2249 [Sphingobacterium siyangense]